MWTPVLFAIAMKQLELVKFLVSKGMNEEICFKEPYYQSEQQTYETSNKNRNTTIALMLAISNYDMPMMEYLWNDHYYLWGLNDLDKVVDFLY